MLYGETETSTKGKKTLDRDSPTRYTVREHIRTENETSKYRDRCGYRHRNMSRL